MIYVLSLFFLAGCSNTEKNTEITDPSPEPVTEPEIAEEIPGAESEGVGEAELNPVASRDTRRLSIRALSKSLTQVTGIEWLEEGESPYHTYRSTYWPGRCYALQKYVYMACVRNLCLWDVLVQCC